MTSAQAGDGSAPTSNRRFSLRQATDGDAEQVASLIARVWTKNFGWSVPPRDLEIHLATALSVETIRQTINKTDHRFILAEEEGLGVESTKNERRENGDVSAPSNTTSTAGPPDLSAPRIIGVAQLVFGPVEPCLTLPNPVELNRLYIEEAYQGSGLALALVEEAGSLARAAVSGRLDDGQSAVNGVSTESKSNSGGQASLWLGVWENNPRAVRFYEKMGFNKVGEHSFLVGENVRRDWVMEKAI